MTQKSQKLSGLTSTQKFQTVARELPPLSTSVGKALITNVKTPESPSCLLFTKIALDFDSKKWVSGERNFTFTDASIEVVFLRSVLNFKFLKV